MLHCGLTHSVAFFCNHLKDFIMKITLKLKNGDFAFDVAKIAIKYTEDGIEMVESDTTVDTPVVAHPQAVQAAADIDLEKYITYPFIAVLEVPDIHRIYDYVNQTMSVTDFTAIISAVAEYMVTNHYTSSEKFITLIICYTAIAASLRIQSLVLELKFNYINMNSIRCLYDAIYTNADDAAEYRSIRTKLLNSTTIFTKAKPRIKSYSPAVIKSVSDALNAGYSILAVERWTSMSRVTICDINSGRHPLTIRDGKYVYPISHNAKWPTTPTSVSVRCCKKCGCLIPAIHVVCNPTIDYCPDCQ